jgi:hypothetical protein
MATAKLVTTTFAWNVQRIPKSTKKLDPTTKKPLQIVQVQGACMQIAPVLLSGSWWREGLVNMAIYMNNLCMDIHKVQIITYLGQGRQENDEIQLVSSSVVDALLVTKTDKFAKRYYTMHSERTCA